MNSDILNKIEEARTMSILNSGKTFYVIFNTFGETSRIDTVPSENEETGDEIVATLFNGEEI